MTAESAHAAAGQALGYFQQCMRALAELGRRTASNPSVAMRLETLDDIDFTEAGSPTELLQTKHHIGAGTLSVNSVDLWRTLNVWMGFSLAETPILRLVTTQVADDTLALLRDGNERDELQAHQL